MHPPKCSTCGKTEWGHLCLGKPKRARRAATAEPVVEIVDVVAAAPLLAIAAPVAVVEPAVVPPKVSRKEYLRLKAIDRRARQKREKEARSDKAS
jgi:hypothetical protein